MSNFCANGKWDHESLFMFTSFSTDIGDFGVISDGSSYNTVEYFTNYAQERNAINLTMAWFPVYTNTFDAETSTLTGSSPSQDSLTLEVRIQS